MTQRDIAGEYRDTGAKGANQLEMVRMMYDVLLDDLRRAVKAIRERNVETRTFELQHALRVLEQLQGALDMENGGEVAANLDRLYSIVRARILEAQWKVSEEILNSEIALLTPVRDAWQEAATKQPYPAPPPGPVEIECRT